MLAIIVKHKEKFVNNTLRSDVWLVFKLLLTAIIPVTFIIQEPDLGVSLVFLFITAVLIILSDIDWKVLFILIISGIAALVLSVLLIVNAPELSEKFLGIKPYQIDREIGRASCRERV